MTKDIPVYKTDYGISSNYGDFIEINRKLDFYPNLKHKIMQHELRHTSISLQNILLNSLPTTKNSMM